MATYATIKVEFSTNSLATANASATWTDVTRYVRSVDWFSGKQRDLDDPQSGGATIILRNDQRRFEPGYVAGAYYPNIVPMRRFRLTVTADGTAHSEGIYYATSWDVTYPAHTTYSEVAVTCVDGFGILSLDLLPALDPPDAMLISDVIEFDQPFAYYRMNDIGGGTLIGRKKRVHHHHHHAPPPPPPPHRHRHNRRHQHHHHRHEGQGTPGTHVSNPNAPLFSQPGLVTGDPDTSTLYQDGDGAYTQISLSDGQFGSTNQFSADCLYEPISSTGGATSYLMAGPWNAGISAHTFALTAQIGSFFTITLRFSDGSFLAISSSTPPTVGAAAYVCATWDGTSLNLYINDTLENTDSSHAGKTLRVGTSSDFVYIGGSGFVAHNANGWIDEAAFYDRALPADRTVARFNAAFHRGYIQTSDTIRVAAITNSTLWSNIKNYGSAFQVVPTMQTGQPKLDEIIHVVHAAQPWSLFFFDGVGDPNYRGWDYLGVTGLGPISTPAATFGDAAGEVPYTDITLTYDDEIYNSATISGNTGVAQTATDTTSQSAYMNRAYSDTGMPLVNDSDAANIAGTIISMFSQPLFRCDAITLNGAQALSRTQILTREIGDLIRVRRRGAGGTPIDIVTRILGKSKSFDPDGNLTCTWSLARGFNAADGFDHLGVTGFTELGSTMVLA